MDLRSLRYFSAVAKQASFPRAAEELHITQPALSRNIARLEKELGARLFDRTSDGVTLTALGNLLQSQVELILNQWTKARATLDNARTGLEGSVTLGVTPGLQRGLLVEVVRKLAIERPRLKLVVTSGLTGDSLSMQLLRGELDLVLGPLQRSGDQSELKHEALFRDEVAPVVHKSHPALRRKGLSLAHVTEYPWVLFKRDVLSRQNLVGVLVAAGLIPPTPHVECDSPEFALSLIVNAGMIGYLPRRYYRSELRDGSVVELQVRALIWSQVIGVSYLNVAGLSQAATVVLTELKSLVRSAPRRFKHHVVGE